MNDPRVTFVRADIAAPSEPLRAVHNAVRASVPRMDVDREVAGQITAVDALLPQLCRVAADGFPSFQ